MLIHSIAYGIRIERPREPRFGLTEHPDCAITAYHHTSHTRYVLKVTSHRTWSSSLIFAFVETALGNDQIVTRGDSGKARTSYITYAFF
jgi:hypothetical protein